MTAIFAVWNSHGVAIAADQIISTTSESEDGQKISLWTDTDSKLFKLGGHGITVGTSGSSSVNRISVAALIRTWSKKLEEPLGALSEYVKSFAEWYVQEVLPNDTQVTVRLEQRLKRIVFAVLESAKTNEETDLQSAMRLVADWAALEPPNVYGGGLQSWLNLHGAKESNVKPDLKTELLTSLVDLQSVTAEWRNWELEHVVDVFSKVFEQCTQTTLDLENAEHQELATVVAQYVLDYIDEESGDATLLFVGYGENDWIPHAAVIHLQSYISVLPRLWVQQVTNSDLHWYVSIAQSDSVDTFTRGFNSNLLEQIMESSLEVQRIHLEAILSDLGRDRFSQMMQKIDMLTIPKLEFIAKSFVEIESLGSFLTENLPSVGGSVDVVSIYK